MNPSKSLLDKSFVYIPAASTDVTNTWRRFGWKPLSDDPRRYVVVYDLQALSS